jgi:hypothetical protein
MFTAKQSVERQRTELKKLLLVPLNDLAERCATTWHERAALEHLLKVGLKSLPFCRYIAALDVSGHQTTSRIGRDTIDSARFGVDRSSRPYMQCIPDMQSRLILSEAYVSKNARITSITAIQLVAEGNNELGFITIDFHLKDLPLTATLYDEPQQWRQLKGDPSIRGTLFLQERTESILDQNIDNGLGLIYELLSDRGVFQAKIHFSSSRASIILFEDPYRGRILSVDELVDPDILLAYPRQPYPKGVALPSDMIRPILDRFKELRFADETIYLRSGSINLFSGVIAVTFSCDGSHYMHFAEFLDKGLHFWLGQPASSSASTMNQTPINQDI